MKHYDRSASFFPQRPEVGNYMWMDMERQCKKLSLPWQRPTIFPRTNLLPMRIATAIKDQNWCEDFCKAVMQRNFALDLEIYSPDSIRLIIDELGQDSASILSIATSEETKLKLKTVGELTIQRGIFGAPSFIANGSLFWGNDRLEDVFSCVSDVQD